MTAICLSQLDDRVAIGDAAGQIAVYNQPNSSLVFECRRREEPSAAHIAGFENALGRLNVDNGGREADSPLYMIFYAEGLSLFEAALLHSVSRRRSQLPV